MKKTLYITAAALSLTITACSTTTIIPEEGNKQTIISTDNNTKNLVENIRYRAERFCYQRGKKTHITKIDVTHQGLDKNQKKLVNQASYVLPRGKVSGEYVPSKYKFKGAVSFRCK